MTDAKFKELLRELLAEGKQVTIAHISDGETLVSTPREVVNRPFTEVELAILDIIDDANRPLIADEIAAKLDSLGHEIERKTLKNLLSSLSNNRGVLVNQKYGDGRGYSRKT